MSSQLSFDFSPDPASLPDAETSEYITRQFIDLGNRLDSFADSINSVIDDIESRLSALEGP